MTEQDAIDQLAALLDGEADAAGAPESLGALLTLADTVRDTADVMAPSPEFRASLREQVLAQAEAPPGLVERARAAWTARTAGLRASARVAVATMTASSMIGSAGVAVAAQDALPGELLYGVKGLTEDARLALATSDVAQARLHLAFAQERLEELEAMSGELTTDQVVALLAEMDFHSEAGAEVLIDAVTAGIADTDEINRFTDGQRNRLSGVLNSLPLLAKPVAEDSLELLRRIEVNAAGSNPQAASSSGDSDSASLVCPRCGSTTESPEASRREPVSGLLDSGDRATRRVGTEINAPGDGPALPDLECDCIELPGGEDAREPAADDEPDEADDAPRDKADEAEEEPEEPPFQPEGGFSDPDSGGDDEQTIEAPTSLEQLPLEETSEAVEDVTGLESDAGGAPERAAEGVDDLLD